MEDINEVLMRLHGARLTAHVNKCQFILRRIRSLGHVLKDGVIKMDLDKVAAIAHLQRPLAKRSLKFALGLFGYYQYHVRDFSTKSYLLAEMLLKRNPDRLVRTKVKIEAFEHLRGCLLKQSVLYAPDRHHGYVIQTDASILGISAVLLQRIDGIERVIAYASQKLLPVSHVIQRSSVSC